jgi:hypothetical protein
VAYSGDNTIIHSVNVIYYFINTKDDGEHTGERSPQDCQSLSRCAPSNNRSYDNTSNTWFAASHITDWTNEIVVISPLERTAKTPHRVYVRVVVARLTCREEGGSFGGVSTTLDPFDDE